ncbi:MAG: hypothetical protein GW903_08110 [Alphaproteobacteria bacterium]|nr:hypothetical protein [Alphaproteobacteria bacterium]NCQ88825.1 hypothetical protein [Alphaproteobacteria bacterium]NCT07252.1 hypothetical protein [Alphaproteobacteria bacterium]
MPNYNVNISKVLWLWIPILALIAKIKTELYIESKHLEWLVGENGPYEILEAVILLIALGITLFTLLKMDKSNKWLMAWIGLAALCCFYVAGEEISWGQHILQWNTPEYCQMLNDQGETNLHNTSSWFDQKPRLLLSIGVYFGGIIIPLLMQHYPHLIKNSFLNRFQNIFPTRQFMVVAFICLFIKITDKIADVTSFHLFARNAESEEMFLFYFVLLYVLLMKKRLISAKKAG